MLARIQPRRPLRWPPATTATTDRWVAAAYDPGSRVSGISRGSDIWKLPGRNSLAESISGAFFCVLVLLESTDQKRRLRWARTDQPPPAEKLKSWNFKHKKFKNKNHLHV
jgi:hypothetical protein